MHKGLYRFVQGTGSGVSKAASYLRSRCMNFLISLSHFYRLWLPKGFSASMAKEWIDKRRLSIRPWAGFVDQRKFSKPRNFGEFCQRVVKNVEIYNSNYTFIFLGLILYCM